VAAAFYALIRRRVTQIPLEAIIGVSYAIAAAGALLLVGLAPGGHIHIQEMLAGSILWAGWTELISATALFGVVGVCFTLFRGPLASTSESYDTGSEEGFRALGWDFLFYALLGVVVTLGVRLAGVVVVFSFLIIPATASALFASSWRERLIAAWITGGVASLLGILFAERLDFSVGPAIALFLGIALVLVGSFRTLHLSRTLAAGLSLTIALAALLWLLLGLAPPRGV
jgi:zinc/manganese transport system permease protein